MLGCVYGIVGKGAAMSSPTKYERRYKCSVIKEDVTIHGLKKTLYP
jgi:hypothetical protein